MGAMKEFAHYCRERDLDPSRGIIKLGDDQPLTSEDLEQLTDGQVGVFTLPCPYCGPEKLNSARFRIDRPTLRGARWHCFYCGVAGEIRAEGPIDPDKETAARRAAAAREKAQKAAKTASALEIWNDAVPVVGTPVIDYLRARAIHDLPPHVDAVLRFHPACPFGREGQRRCMLALLRDVRTNEPRAVHRTWLGVGGKAFGRMAFGPIARAAVKLWPAGGETLVVGEGIETTLAAALYLQRSDGAVLRPAWALTVANNLARLPLVKGVRRLIILADNDKSGVGQRAAELCSQRWCDAGRESIRMLPDQPGTDFNDVVRGMSR
jgi:hypothetical protein